MEGWEEALHLVAGISGWTLTINQDESDIVEDIVKKIKSAKFDVEISIEPQIKKLKNELQEIRAVIDDAEEIVLPDRSVKIWLTNLKYLAFELDDIVDEFDTHILTRNQMMDCQGGLSDDDSLSIFARHALVPRDFKGYPHFKEVAKKIARKCNGLPLAAKILGGLLRTVDLNAWKDILESEIWNSPQCNRISPSSPIAGNRNCTTSSPQGHCRVRQDRRRDCLSPLPRSPPVRTEFYAIHGIHGFRQNMQESVDGKKRTDRQGKLECGMDIVSHNACLSIPLSSMYSITEIVGHQSEVWKELTGEVQCSMDIISYRDMDMEFRLLARIMMALGSRQNSDIDETMSGVAAYYNLI
ncbi:NB-ARC domain-containing protein [Corchorus olitorius]|uniref:NB-ARC domain-containing protein n=1 Tax=Corchorus olitorius TaxID=93759 RepID=A0A1R3IX78_9ROSI|nr:NB-ARC domain-containing protein [Corchorus olitorius]